jgi:thymidine kinase
MNAGKTTTLLQSSFNYEERGMKTILFTPDFSHNGKIVSRIGIESECIVFNNNFDFGSVDISRISCMLCC